MSLSLFLKCTHILLWISKTEGKQKVILCWKIRCGGCVLFPVVCERHWGQPGHANPASSWIQLEDEQAAKQNKAFSWPYTVGEKKLSQKSVLGAGNRNKAFSSLYMVVEDQGHGYQKKALSRSLGLLLVKWNSQSLKKGAFSKVFQSCSRKLEYYSSPGS